MHIAINDTQKRASHQVSFSVVETCACTLLVSARANFITEGENDSPFYTDISPFTPRIGRMLILLSIEYLINIERHAMRRVTRIDVNT